MPRQWPRGRPRPSANPSAGVPAQLGLHFVLRSVTTTSYSTDGPSVDAYDPAGQARWPPQPSPTADPSFDDDIHSLDAGAARLEADRVQRGGGRRPAARQRSVSIRSPVTPGVPSTAACQPSARQLGPAQGADTRLAVISDMENNEPVVGLSLAGAAVLMVTICPADLSTSCPQRLLRRSAYLMRHGASSVQIVSADAVTPQTFDDFWRA